MKSFVSSFCAAAMVASVAVPAHAGVVQVPTVSPTSNVIKVQGTDYYGGGGPGLGRLYRGGPEWRGNWRGHDWDGPRWRGKHHYWRGHRGYRHYRPGYRRHGDWWFPAAAFITGAIVGGALASPPRVRYRSMSSAHVAWCYDRWRSYREWDNTYQPYHGPRRECVSPYWP